MSSYLSRFWTWMLLPVLVLSVSLSEFQPAASNLTPACAAVYLRTIPGCRQSDFPNCSSACIKGMIAINEQVYRSCSGSTQDDQLLIAVFLQGNGIHTLCQNVAVATSAPKSSPPPALPSTSSMAPVSTSSATCLVVDTRSPPSVSRTVGIIYTKSKSHSHSHEHRTSTHSSLPRRTTSSSSIISHVRAKPTKPSTTSIKVGQTLHGKQTSSTTALPTSTSTTACTDNGSPFGEQCSGGTIITLPTTHLLLTMSIVAIFTFS